jgi:MoxR-like ATPase
MKRDIKQLLQHLKADAIESLDNGAFHRWSQNEIDALHLALAAGRPLLVRGEPGTGKTQLARAAAKALKWHLQCVTISPRSEAQDLFHRFDAVQRLADAQAASVKPNKAYYWLPGPFWRAFDWEGAKRYGPLAVAPTGAASIEATPTEATPPGQVILIDEIDKADSDLPNSLLEVLGSREFANPVTGEPIKPTAGLPLVMITTNEERELPSAFLRRCVVLTLEADESYAAFLVKRGRAHFGADSQPEHPLDDEILEIAARQLADDRHNAKAAGVPPPGLAEYIDLLTALRELAPGNCDEQVAWLKRLVRFAFLKNGVVEGFAALSQNPPVDNAKG